MTLNARQIKARRKYVGGSEALAALGKDTRCSRLELFMRKTGQLPEPDLSDDQRVRFGNLLEPVMRKVFKLQIGGLPVLSRTEFRLKDAHLVAHPDGWIPDLECGVEFKNVDRFEADDYGEEQTDQVPLQHLVQCMTYMAVTGAREWYLCPLIGGNDFRTYEIKRDESLCDAIVLGVKDFWSYIERETPPDPSTPDDVKLRWPKDLGTSITATTEVLGVCRDLNEAITARKVAVLREEGLKMELQQFMQAHSELIDEQGNKLATWRRTKDSSPVIDLEMLGEKDPALLDALLLTYPKLRPGYRKFLLK